MTTSKVKITESNRNPSIEYLQVTIEPYSFPQTGVKILRVSVQVEGNKYGFEQVLIPNEFERDFDCIMDVAKKEIKEAIKARSSQKRPIKRNEW